MANVSYELERYVQGLWIDAGNSTTDDEGFAVIYNLTDGEYRWTAYYENEEIDDGWFLLQANSASNIGHVGYFYDLDDDDDFDDFAFFIEEDNETNALSYVEIFYEDNNTLYKSDSADDGNDEEEIIFYDVPEGNYTFNAFNLGVPNACPDTSISFEIVTPVISLFSLNSDTICVGDSTSFVIQSINTDSNFIYQAIIGNDMFFEGDTSQFYYSGIHIYEIEVDTGNGFISCLCEAII